MRAALLLALAGLPAAPVAAATLEEDVERAGILFNQTLRPGAVQDPKAALPPFVTEILEAAASLDRAPVWPGYRVLDQPVLLLEGKERSWLIAHPAPPAAFKPVSAEVRVADGEAIELAAPFDFYADIGGKKAFAYRLLDPSHDRDTVVHERFHVFQFAKFKRTPPKGGTVEDGENHALAAVEQRALLAAITSPDADARAKAARWFVAARAERNARWGEQFGSYEDHFERHEGMAKYVELRTADRMAAPEARVDVWIPVLAGLDKIPDLHDMMRARYYETGAVQGLLLDRSSRAKTWKLKVQGGTSLYRLTSQTFPVADADRAAVLQEAKTALGYDAILEKASKTVADRRAAREKALDDFEKQDGVFVSVPAHPSRIGYKNGAGGSFRNSGEWYQVPGGSLFTRIVVMEQAEFADFRWVVRDRAVLETDAAVFFAVSEVSAVADGKEFEPEDGETAFRNLSLKAPGFELTTSIPGRLVRKGRDLTIVWDAPAAAPSGAR